MMPVLKSPLIPILFSVLIFTLLSGCTPPPNIILPGEVVYCIMPIRVTSAPNVHLPNRLPYPKVAGSFLLDTDSSSQQFGPETTPVQVYLDGRYFLVSNPRFQISAGFYHFQFDLPSEATRHLHSSLSTGNMFTADSPATGPIQIRFRAGNDIQCWIHTTVAQIAFLTFTNRPETKLLNP